MALMSQDDLGDLVAKDDVQLVAHELAHQWWGVMLGIRSWSDFWLNEGFAEFMSDAYIEKHQGRTAYDKQIAELQDRMKKLREQGKDRPLHWEKWKDAHEALGPIPYVKGALGLEPAEDRVGRRDFLARNWFVHVQERAPARGFTGFPARDGRGKPPRSDGALPGSSLSLDRGL